MSQEETRGCVHIYCGDGKGKTSAAVGLAVRAAGRGKKVLVVRFLKSDDSGEVAVLCGIDGIEVMPCEKEFGFYFRMTDVQKAEAGTHYRGMLEAALGKVEAGDYDVLILDEIMAVCNYGLISEERFAGWVAERRPRSLELVMTGRDPSERMKALADYISVIQMERHPYQQGIPARLGIEY